MIVTKKRLAIDYSQTINRFPLLDAFPLPKINDLVNDIALIEEGVTRPVPERLSPLRNLPVPRDSKSLNRCLGLFSYYSQWIPEFSNRIKPLTSCKSFPLSPEAVTTFDSLKKIVEEAFVAAIDETISIEVEADASDVALAATLSQDGKPVAFFARSLQGSELTHAAIEREAQAIIEAIRHWRDLLTGRHFTLRTDQKSVSYMFDQRNRCKKKNDTIKRWGIEPACYSFDIVYRPGKEDVLPHALSRATCASAPQDSLYKLHEALCHPGITRLNHFIRTKNLPYSLDEVKRVTSECQSCAETKPRYHKPEQVPLIKATQPFERINIDFRDPLPSSNGNKYFLNIVDEYSRFPFVFPCSDISKSTVIKCLTTLFSLFGMPAFVYSDRGTSFMSHELQAFL